METSRAPRIAPLRGDVLGGVRARVRALAHTEETVFSDLGLRLYSYPRQTELATLTARGVGFCLVLQGEKRVQIGAEALCVPAGQMLVATRDTELRTVVDVDEGRQPYLALGLWFDAERVARVLLRLAELGMASTGTEAAEGADASPVFRLTPPAEMAASLERLLDTVADPIECATIAPLILDELVFRLLRTDAAAATRAGVGPQRDAARILEVMQFIRAHHAKKLTVRALAKRLAMSPSHFAHTFSSIARTSPMKYVREVRLERAKVLLSAQGARPAQVASQVGFESAAHFAREFRRRYGTAPSEYRGRTLGAGQQSAATSVAAPALA